MTARRNGAVARRLEQLFEISKLFASFDNADQPLDAVLAIISRTLPLRSAILVETDETISRMIFWPSEGQGASEMAEVRARAETAYDYLVDPAGPHPEQLGGTRLPLQELQPLENRFIAIPLVVFHRKIFGVLQLEAARALDKGDLLFVNAITNQLAVALDRDSARKLDVRRRMLAEAGRVEAEDAGARFQKLATENAALYAQATEAVRVREHILEIVSHDLRNPLATIAFSTALLSRDKALSERLSEAVARIARAADRMQRLTDDLLDHAGLATGKLAMKFHLEDPAGVVRETATSFDKAAEQRGIVITAGLGPDLPEVSFDRGRLLQVLSNLAGNAVKLATSGGHIMLRAKVQGPDMLFSVTDDGPGISAEDVLHLFERYWRGGEAQYKGQGLGLGIAQGIVEAHGGRIWVESTLGQGATFFFTIPLSRH